MTAIDLEPGISNAEPEYRYDLSPEAAQQLTRDLLRERPPEGDARFVCYNLDGGDPYSNIARQIECKVFDQTFNNDAEEMRQEYGPYEQQSSFYLSIDTEREKATGVLRAIENGPAGLKSINDLSAMNSRFSAERIAKYHGIEDMDECLDAGTVAVLPEYRSGEGSISVQLYRGLYIGGMEKNKKHLISIVDSKPLSKLTDYLGIPFVPLAGAEPMEYLGSKRSQAVYGYMPDFYSKMNKQRYTWRGLLARKVLSRLVQGSQDEEFQFDSRYKK